MKKLAILVSLVVATPVFACPHDSDSAPKTADKDKAKDAPAPAKDQPKKDAAKPAETAKAKDQPKKSAEPKKPTKVSQK